MTEIAELAEAYRRGETLEMIGRRLGYSRERIRQLLLRSGITGQDGGQAVRSRIKRAAAAARREAARARRNLLVLQGLGCSAAEAEAINGGPFALIAGRPDPIGCYLRHRRNARRRGIAWELTLPEWWELWKEHYPNRRQYRLCRKNRTEGYSRGNVEVQRRRQKR